ncbi:MAG: insulinase family protein [Bacteroidales bacterium]|jgi:predicted Zn-dependent peptidase|nr:insulinase family protein [Bacteroidales bacterium]
MISGRADCGIRYAVKRSGSAVAYCSLGIACGTRYEQGFHSGIAHFTEHTLFKGTEHKSSSVINGYLDRLGGELNAYTTKEEIVLHATILKEDLSKASSLLMEIATEATFPDNEVNTERGVVIDEIKSYKDSPSEDVYDRFEEKLFRGHSLSMPILGTPQSVRATSAEELRRFYKEKFVPESMVFTIVADIDEKRMEADLLRTFDKFFSGSGMVSGELTRPKSVTLDNVFDEVINKRNHEANAVLGGYAPSLYEERERIATSLMSNILGGPAMNSILNDILREKHGWVYGVESSYTQYSDTGIMAISLGCERENTEKCIDAVRREISKFQDNALTDRKLRAAKKQFLGQIAISSDNGESQCLSMGKSLLAYGKVASAEEIKREIEAVSADMIRDMACRIFAPDRTSCLILL